MASQIATSSSVIDLSGFRPEPHVERAFVTARELAAGGPIMARHAIVAAVQLAPLTESAAFQELARQLSTLGFEDVGAVIERPGTDVRFAVSRALAESFERARPFLSGDGLSGRDYVTIALTAVGDPSLEDLADRAGTTLKGLRATWFEFVTSAGDGRRAPDEWKRWLATVPATPATGGRESAPPAYLLTWDPRDFPFPDLEELVRAIRSQSMPIYPWKVGDGAQIESGSRVFLVRQGADPRGIVGSGRVVDQSVPASKGDDGGAPHSGGEVEVAWETLSREPILNRPELVHATHNESLWASAVSGIPLPADVFVALERAWRVATAHPGLMDPDLDRGDYLRRFDRDALDALAESWGLAQAESRTSIHMEHLLPGLLRAGGGVFEGILDARGLDAKAVMQGLDPSRDTPLPDEWPRSALEELPPLSRHALQALRMAERRAEALADGVIGPRDLVNGVLSITDCDVVQRLAQMGLTRAHLPWAWEPPIRLAGYWSDSTSGTDLLDMGRDARVLATIMASSKVSPPLSIGLFGPWGSGKSFFMKLLQREVRALEQSEASDYCRRVVQIRFNAWHYIDSNLWASLANEVFEQLGREIEAQEKKDGTPDPDSVDVRRNQAARLLMAARRSRSELEEATRRKEEAERDLAGAEAELGRLREEQWLLQGPIPPERLAEEALRGLMAEDRWRKELDEVLERLGLTTKDLSPRALESRLQLWRGRWRWILGWWKAAMRPGPARSITIASLAAFIVAVIVPWESILTWTSGWLDEGAAAVTLIVGAVLPHLSEAKRLIERVRPVVERLDQVQEVARQRLEAEGAQKRDLVDARYARAREEEQAKREELRRTESELRSLLADDQIRRFVSQRRESEDYRSHLGVIARARQDFEQLSRLLERPAIGSGAGDPLLTEAERALERELEAYRPELPEIDRIVLYIDDLDRCPEEKVVDVLQAVHLLLAFQLFVVVVGVDPRWLLHSLADRSDVFREPEENDEDDRAQRYWRTTPMDYLEKIFQIPFHLRPMGEQGFGALVTALTRDREGEAREAEARAEAGPPSSGAPPEERRVASKTVVQDGATVEREEVHRPTEQDRSSDRATVVPAVGAEAVREVRPGNASSPAVIGTEGTQPGVADQRLRGPRLTIASWERRFMQALHPFIQSPRSAKRFVNVYRLVRASHIESLMGTATAGPGGDTFHGDEAHYQVLFLVAMLTGHPGPTFTLFRLMKQSGADESWSTFRAALAAKNASATPGSAGDDGMSSRDGTRVQGDDWREFVDTLERAHAEMRERGFSFDPLVRELRAWVPKVARYSFRSGTTIREQP